MLQTVRERFVLLLFAALPFHALFVTVLTKIIAGPGHSPLPLLALWKEALLGGILLLAIMEWMTKHQRQNIRDKIDALDACIVGLLGWSLLQPLVLHSPLSVLPYVLGFKYDFLPLIAFFVLRRVPWSPWFSSTARTVLLGMGITVAAYGIVTAFLSMSWFTWLGYSDLHSLYLPNAPLAAFQQIGGTAIRRIQSTMSGPNQLGLWLLIPWSLGVVEFSRKKSFVRLFVCSCIGLAVLLTFSRAAWVAAAVISMIASWRIMSKKKWIIAGCWLLVMGILAVMFAPDIVLRMASSRGHWERPIQALRLMQEHPWGMGLGSAGPASNRLSDVCIELEAGSDASWAEERPDLCVYVGGKQVQPLDQPCRCPVLPENWYLQIGVELGWIGLVLYTVLMATLLWRCYVVSFFGYFVSEKQCTDAQTNKRINDLTNQRSFSNVVSCTLLGISIAAFFLHAWEDTAIAYTTWIMLAGALPPVANCYRSRSA